MRREIGFVILGCVALGGVAALPREARAGHVECATTTGDQERHIALERQDWGKYLLLWRVFGNGGSSEGRIASELDCELRDDDPGVIAVCREVGFGRCVYVSRTEGTVRFQLTRHMFGRCVGLQYEEVHDRETCAMDTSTP